MPELAQPWPSALDQTPVNARVTPRDDAMRTALAAFLDLVLDGVEPCVLTELVSESVAVDILCFPPTEVAPVWTFVTSGMSDLPMAVPGWSDYPPYAELMICLDWNWPIGADLFASEAAFWPIRLLRTLARYPHTTGAVLAPGQTFTQVELADDDESDSEAEPADSVSRPRPLSPGLPFTGVLLGVPLLLSDKEDPHIIPAEDDGRALQILTILPLHPAELDLARRRGVTALTDAFARMARARPDDEITEHFNPHRPDATDF